MNSFQVLEKVDPTEWDNDLIRLNGCCFHSYEWSLFSSERNNAKPLYFRWHDDSGEFRGLTFGLLTTKTLAGIQVYKALSFGSLPVSDNDSALHNMVKEIVSYSRISHITSLGINSFGTPFSKSVLKNQVFFSKYENTVKFF